MKVCIIAEGCYPYVVGGVSSWIHNIIKSFPDIEFNLIAIISNRKGSGSFAYDLADNLTKIHEVYLQDVDWVGQKKTTSNRIRLNKREFEALRSLVIGENVDWVTVFRLFNRTNISINNLLMSPQFLSITKEYYSQKYINISFSDFYGPCVLYICRFFWP